MINSEYKDRLFSFIYGSEENKAWTLSLYNAINESSYTDPESIVITTIKQVLYMGMHNDVSFLISNEMALFEEQSTYNPNMPLRMLQYIGNLYEKYIRENGLNKYSSILLQLPIPKLVVFYIGDKKQPDETILRLSDSFPEGSNPDIEVRVKMLNINPGRNKELMQACKTLREYAWLMERVRKLRKTMDLEDAVDQAIRELPEEFVLRPFLMAHRAEVKGMLLTEYNEAEQRELDREDGRKEGKIEGKEETLIENIKSLMDTLKLSAQQAMNALKIPAADQQKYASKL